MKVMKKLGVAAATLLTVLTLAAGTASADQVRIGWGFLFPIPVPLPIYQVPHDPSPVTVGLLFPIPIPLPFYDYGYYKTAREVPPPAPAPRQPSRYGQLQLEVRPESASVFVNGQYFGHAGDFATRQTAATVYPGQARIEIKAQGYRDYVVNGDIKPGELVMIRYDLQPEGPPPAK